MQYCHVRHDISSMQFETNLLVLFCFHVYAHSQDSFYIMNHHSPHPKCVPHTYTNLHYLVHQVHTVYCRLNEGRLMSQGPRISLAPHRTTSNQVTKAPNPSQPQQQQQQENKLTTFLYPALFSRHNGANNVSCNVPNVIELTHSISYTFLDAFDTLSSFQTHVLLIHIYTTNL